MILLHHGDRASDQSALMTPSPGGVADFSPPPPLPEADAIRDARWIDLVGPVAAEKQLVETVLGLELPSRAEMLEIEASSRFYRERGATYITILIVVGVDADEPGSVPVTFILAPTGQLVTVRFDDPQPFRAMTLACTRQAQGAHGLDLAIRLFELVIERTADLLERASGEIDTASRLIFGRGLPADRRLSPADLTALLRQVGTTHFMLHKVHDSLLTLNRAVGFLNLSRADGAETAALAGSASARDRLKSIVRDIVSLTENAAFLTQNIGFLIDAALGRISIEQNAIVKIFSVAAVIFLPPTLVASVYGMNFEAMPELGWRLGYPWALALMLLSAVVPYLWFKRKGWL